MKNDGNEIIRHNENMTAPGVKKSLNLPNKLTLFRLALVPVCMVFIYFPVINEVWSRIFAAALFFIAALTDLADGIMARRLNMITNFGKLMDPLADKFMVVGALIMLTASPMFESLRFLLVWVTAIVFLRELSVTSIRLVANGSDNSVIPASFIGKLKTMAQCVCIMTVLLEKIVLTESLGTPENLFSIITLILMSLLTIYSGFTYFAAYWKYIDPTK